MENTRMSAVKFGQKSSMIAVAQVWESFLNFLVEIYFYNIILNFVPCYQVSNCLKLD